VVGRVDVTGRKFLRGEVSDAERAARYGHVGRAVVFVSQSGEAAHELAARVERRLFTDGVHSFYLGATDLGDDKDVLAREDHLGRLGEIAWAMTDAGSVFVASLGDADRFDLDRLRRLAAPHEVCVVDMDAEGDLGADIELTAADAGDAAAEEALRALAAAGIIPSDA
jgi:bifunctional enzyme CysN/CysC